MNYMPMLAQYLAVVAVLGSGVQLYRDYSQPIPLPGRITVLSEKALRLNS